MDGSTGVSKRTTVKNFELDALDDPLEEIALDRAFGNEAEAVSNTVAVRRENHPPTTTKEVWGWYLYELANQPYSRYVKVRLFAFITPTMTGYMEDKSCCPILSIMLLD